MTNTLAPKAAKRYYGDNCCPSTELDSADMLRELHALYTHWLELNCLARDFTVVVEHAATMVYLNYAVAGHPVFTGELPKLAETARASGKRPLLSGPALRFFDESNSINRAIDLQAFDAGLAPLFIRWVAQGWHARDFVQASKDCAGSVIYEHDICRSMGGLGGCRTGQQFLNEPYCA